MQLNTEHRILCAFGISARVNEVPHGAPGFLCLSDSQTSDARSNAGEQHLSLFGFLVPAY